MFNIQLRPEVRKELKDPDGFASGLGIVYTGLTITMTGVVMMLILYFNKPEHVLHPTWLLFIGLATVVWGEVKKARCK